MRYLECVELCKASEHMLFTQLLREINFICATDEVESIKIITTFARDVLLRFHWFVDSAVLELCI